jgi:hypothetical protein
MKTSSLFCFLLSALCIAAPAQGPLPNSLSVAKLFLSQQPALPPPTALVYFYDAFTPNGTLTNHIPTTPDPAALTTPWSVVDGAIPQPLCTNGAASYGVSYAQANLATTIPLNVTSNYIYTLTWTAVLSDARTGSGDGLWFGFDDGQASSSIKPYGPGIMVDGSGKWIAWTNSFTSTQFIIAQGTNTAALTNSMKIVLDTHGAISWGATFWLNGSQVATTTNVPALPVVGGSGSLPLVNLGCYIRNQNGAIFSDYIITLNPITVTRQ